MLTALIRRLASSASFDNTGQEYDLTRILTHETALNRTEYSNYSPLFISCVDVF